ncbi:MAG: transposase family protein [Heteroscytonema crispum UTEX LB 1556]
MVDIIAGEPGPLSDITLLRQGQKGFTPHQKFQGDKGYIGEPSIKTPTKKSQKRELTPDQKSKNKEMASSRILVEHLIRVLKIFRVASERFRLNPRKYEQIIMTICGESALREGFPTQATANPEGLVRLRIGALVLPL